MGRRALSLFLLLSLFLFPALRVHGASQGGAYTHVATDEAVVALTFDDGPHPRYTPKILDILAENDARATFFVIGKNLEHYGDIAERAVREGHEIGNHTYSHPTLFQLDDGEILYEILKNEAIIEEKTGYMPTLFRPPEGYCTTAIERVAKNAGSDVVLWSVDTRDWSGIASARIVSHVMENVRPGSIILFHDYIAENSPTPAALKEILPRLRAAGYRFVTVSELITHTLGADSD